MLSGQRPFAGETVSDTLASILESEPDFDQLPSDTPAALRRLLRRCLHKDPHHRLHDADDARIVLEEVAAGGVEEAVAGSGVYERLSSRRTLLLMAAAAIAAAALTIGIAGLLPSADPPEYPTVFFPIPAPPETRLEQVSISPDGKRFAFIAESARGVTEIWVRDLTGRETRKLKGTEGARDLFWSPDSRFVGYFTAENVWKVDAETGDAVKVAVSPDGRWMAYVSDENGQWDVYVASFPDGERRWRISTASGNQPRWNPRGGELFFLSSDRRMMSVRTRSESDTFLWDAPQVLFQTAIVDLGPHRGCWAYAITPDGESFIILTRQVQSESPAVAVLNWR